MNFLDNFDATFGEVDDGMDIFRGIMFNSDNSDDDEIREIETIRIRKEYRMFPRIDHLNKWDDGEFLYRFRLSKRTVCIILDKIENQLMSENTFIDVKLKFRTELLRVWMCNDSIRVFVCGMTVALV